MLYLVATPIGNLKDITIRAIETLESCDYILCEDTRHSLTLLRHYNIEKPLKSYHKFNECSQSAFILQDLKEGKSICLISDAGSPGISDPGTLLVQKCVEENIPVISIPGPCAAIAALCCSGLPTDCFQFHGFLPKKESELKNKLSQLLDDSGTTICYESPQRIMKTVEMIREIDAKRKLVIGRELTKKFEEFIRGDSEEILEHLGRREVKGEIVLMMAPKEKDDTEDWKSMTPEEHVEFILQTYKTSKQEAIKIAAKLRGIPKREVYRATLSD